ncbi:MAG: CoA transferase [Bifidobacteriaceae bacterium]|jgi:crotonobetainyl-CoA:carnitine CoA-transferase CaiB-like acyl-CoA transferase|nr:CoA transferase [Bifidobacteriaceae bacterium]
MDEVRPLAGVLVIDLVDTGTELAGRFLADLGADVVRVEPPGGAPGRTRGTVVDGVSLDFALNNRGKKSIALDLAKASDVALAKDLLVRADILIETPATSGLAAAGLGPERIAALNPTLVHTAVSDFGGEGPHAGWVGTPDVHSAASSVLSRSGFPETPEPLLLPEPLPYVAASAQAAWDTMLAYYIAVTTGRGGRTDFSIQHALVNIFDPQIGSASSNTSMQPPRDIPRGRPEGRHLYPIFKAADGYVRICVLSPRQWQGMLQWLGSPEELTDPKWNSIGQRFGHPQVLTPYYEKLFAPKTRAQAVDEGQKLGVPIAGLATVEELSKEPGFAEAGAFTVLELAPGLSVTAPTQAIEIDNAKGPLPPLMGDPDSGREAVLALASAPAPVPHKPVDATGPVDRPLAGLRVLDLGVIVAGGELGRLFADYGADVIKVESREFPDGSRQTMDPKSPYGLAFAYMARSKRSLGVNLRTEEGRALFLKLIEKSDLVLTNFKAGTMDRLGLGFEVLAAHNPGIVLSESSAFGNHGPWASRGGYGPLVRASAGLSLAWRYPDQNPGIADAVTIYPDQPSSRLLAVGHLAQLLRRRRTGRGGRVGVAQVDVIFNALGAWLAKDSLFPGTVAAVGNERDTDAPRGLFALAGDDEWLAVDSQSAEQFAGVARVVGHPEWIDQADLATAQGRIARRAEIDAAVAAWAGGQEKHEAMARLQGAGVPASYMYRTQDVLDDPQLIARGAFAMFSHYPGIDSVEALAAEAVSTTIPTPPMGYVPAQGENTRQIAADLLELSPEQIEEYIASGVLQEPK